MKKLLLLLFIPLVFACSDDVKNNLDNQNLNGNVESLKQIKYGVIEKFGEVYKDESNILTGFNISYISKFNRKGYETESKMYSDVNAFYLIIKYEYDNKNLRIERRDFSEYEDLPVTEKSPLVHRIVYKYDEEGKLIQSEGFDEEGPQYFYKYKYFDNENKMEQMLYLINGKRISGEIYKYDNDGKVLEKSNYKTEGLLETKSSYKYNDNGNLIEELYENYIRHGDVKRKIQKFKYEKFDSENNWLKQIIFEDGKALEITERTIKYYD